MNTPIQMRGARLRRLAIAGTAAAALVLAGCASGGDTAPTEEAEAEVEASGIEAKVAAFMQPRESYDLPTEAIDDPTALEGTTIHYIPITLQAPQFALTSQVLGAAVEAAGAKLTVCNGEGIPTVISQCVDAAANEATTSTIILDGFFIGMVANSAMAAQAAGINVISSNQDVLGSDFPASETLGYVKAPGSDMFIETSSWIALDSGGTGNQLVLLSQDGPINSSFVLNALSEVEADCPDCTISMLDVSSANYAQLPSDLSSRLLQDPNIQYVNSQFAHSLPQALPVVAEGGQKIVTGAATLGAYQAVAGGQVAAASGQSAAFGSWALVDTALRMANGQAVYDYVIPTRLLTADNIGEIELTEAAEASGEWYGPTTFVADFKKLWGV